MKKRLLAVLMALCITSLETMGAYAAVAENGETSQIAVEESEENTEDSGESAEDLSDSSEAQENNTENSGEDGQENVPDQNGENSQDEDSSVENTTESEDDSNQQDPNVEEEDEQEQVLSEASNEGITDEETAAIEEPKKADNAESSDAVMSGECGAEGDNLTWELSGTEKELTLTIRGSGQMASYSQNTRAPWSKNAVNIKHIDLSEEMTSIGDYAFERCSFLTSITIPNSVKSIGSEAFNSCWNLTTITIPEGVTSIGDGAFSSCSRVTSVTIPDSVMSIGRSAFYDCNRLTSITIPEGVTRIEDFTFYNCESLTSITLPESLTGIGLYAFGLCPEIKDIHISSLEKWLKMSVAVNSNLIGNIYLDDEPLTYVNIPEGVTSIRRYAFTYCSSLKSVTIPEGVTRIGEFAFFECSSLKSVTIPEGVTSIEEKAFKGCSNLTSLALPNGLEEIDWYVFDGCNSLEYLCIPYSIETINDDAFYNYYGKIFYWGTNDEWQRIYRGKKQAEFISIALDNNTLVLKRNQSKALQVTSNFEDIGENNIIWSSSDNEIVSVNETGLITANNAGEAMITAATRWGNNTASCAVSVIVPVTGIQLDQEQVVISSGSSKQLFAVIAPDDATNQGVTWTSSNPETVSVNEDGLITAKRIGTTTVTATSVDGGFCANCIVTVIVPVDSVSLDKKEMQLSVGETGSLYAVVLPEDATIKNLLWNSSDESVAVVDSGGNVKAQSAGTAVITVTSEEGKKTDSCIVTVPVPVTGIELEYDNITVDVNTEFELKAIVYPEDAANKSVIWSSSDESVVSINNNGVLHANGGGFAEIIVRTEDGSYTATCQVSVTVPVNEIYIDKDSVRIEEGQNHQLIALFRPENTTETSVTWQSSDTKVATVDAAGIVTAIGIGTAVITASAENGKTAQCLVEVCLPNFSVNYVLNGGKNSPDNPDKYNVSETIELKEATRNGYIFKGWYADEQLTEKVTGIEAGQTGDLTFYAKWSGKTYKIVFNGNTADSGKMSKISYTVGKTASLPSNTFKKKEYVFNGWNTKANGNGVGFKNKGSLGSYDAANGSTITLYAQWKLKDYSIVYKLNGGVNNKSNPATYNFKTAVASLAKPTKKGYSFQGWFTDAKFKNPFKGIKKGSSGNRTVYAKWAVIKYTVSYTLNGGKAPTGNPTSYYVTTNTIKLKNPTKKGYTFGGWYKDSKFKTKIVSIPKGSTGNLKLYAKWTATKYTITYKLNGGTNSKSNPATFTINSANIKFANPSKKGCVFEGWYSDSKFKNKVTVIKKGTTGNKTLYARWKIYEYTITYNLNGGKFPIGNPASYNVNTATIKLKEATKKEYVFAGWYKEATFKTMVTTIPKGSTGNLKLYAKWEKPEENKLRQLYEYILKNGTASGDEKYIIRSMDNETVGRIIATPNKTLVFICTIKGTNGGTIEYSLEEKKWSAFVVVYNGDSIYYSGYTIINPATFNPWDENKLYRPTLTNINKGSLSDEFVAKIILLTNSAIIKTSFLSWEIMVSENVGFSFTQLGFPMFHG